MPVYSQFAGDDETLGLGPRLRHLRKRRGWTLHTLASRLSISIGTLSAIENQKASPDVSLLFAASQALKVPLDALLPPSSTRHYHICRRDLVEAHPPAHMKLVNRARRKAMAYHNRLWALADAFVGKYIEPFEIEIEPLREDNLQFISHNHEEFFFVLHGELECLLKSPDGLLRKTLRPGDCMYFWSHLPHCIRSTKSEPARSVHALYSLHEPADSESADGISGPVIYLEEAPRENVIDQTAGKIVALRQARGMSAVEFGRHLGISARRLAAIESGQRPVSLAMLLHICRTFRKPLEYFLPGTWIDRPFCHVLRAPEIRRQIAQRRRKAAGAASCIAGAAFQPLAEGFKNRGMHPYLVRMKSGKAQSKRLLAHPGQEFVYILKGQVTLLTTLDGKQVAETLRPGDSCFIDSSLPHRFVETGFTPYEKSQAELISVSWHPLDSRGPVPRR